MNSFRTQLITGFNARAMSIIPTDGLEGKELEEAISNNSGMENLFDFITELHTTFSTKKTTSKAKAKAEPEPAVAAEKKAEPEAKPKKIRKPRTKKVVVAAAAAEAEAEEAEPKAKRAPTKYAIFSSLVLKGMKGDRDAWKDTNVTVSFEKISEKGQAYMDHEKALPLHNMKGEEHNLEEILLEILKLMSVAEPPSEDGKQSKSLPFKVAALLWSACGNENPF